MNTVAIEPTCPMKTVDLWCVHIAGPDEVYAARSREQAIDVAQLVNFRLGSVAEEMDAMYEATAQIWPWDADEHGSSLRKGDILGLFLPASQFDLGEVAG
jgi:hypothetical protein